MATNDKPTTTVASASNIDPKLTPEQELIQAEIEAGKAIIAAQNRLAAARAKLTPNPSANIEADTGYGAKKWAGHTILQCHYCPLDVPANEEQRMMDHVAASHPNFNPDKPLYDNLGNAVESD